MKTLDHFGGTTIHACISTHRNCSEFSVASRKINRNSSKIWSIPADEQLVSIAAVVTERASIVD